MRTLKTGDRPRLFDALFTAHQITVVCPLIPVLNWAP
jgi:hypothetical protein